MLVVYVRQVGIFEKIEILFINSYNKYDIIYYKYNLNIIILFYNG